MLRKVVTYYKRKYENIKNEIFYYDLKLLLFKKNTQKIYEESTYFQISYLFKNDKQKNVMY